jgi:hypothetical protein
MAKFFGLEPKSKTQKVAEEFENRIRIRLHNKSLLGKVYTDIADDQWAVAVAYNQVPEPGLWGTENVLEIRYTYDPASEPLVKRLETSEGEEKTFPAEPFDSPDAFVIWALNQERTLIQSPN